MENLETVEKRRPKILEVNYLYMVVAILLILVSSSFNFKSLYAQIIATQYPVILLPMILFIIIRKYKFKEVLRLNKITLKQTLLSIMIPIFAYPVALFFNYISIIIISLFGEIQPPPFPVPQTIGMFSIGLILFAITPGICEEIMFRGVLLSAYERIGMKKAIIITGLLFGLFHFDVQNFLGPAFLGILFAYMVYKTNSIYTTMIAHAINNMIALTLLKLADIVQSIEGVQAQVVVPATRDLLIAFAFLTMVAVSSALVVYFLLKSLSKSNKSIETLEDSKVEALEIKKEKITTIHIIPIIAVVGIFIYSAVMYFRFIMVA